VFKISGPSSNFVVAWMQDMIEILCENLTQDQANTYGLVLASCGLPYSMVRSGSGWEIWVDETIHARALDLVAQYDAENPQKQPLDGYKTQEHKKTYTGIWVSLFLLACNIGVDMSGGIGKIAGQYGASAFDILNGDVYRTVTSLMLHADYPHLAGNMAGIAIFGTWVCNITGAGVGWLMILLTGILGNLANAALFQYGHNSIGASTAVFGAVGFLAAYQLDRKIKVADQRRKAWIPLAGGLALLAFLGAGAHSDLTAHLFGFLAGIFLGLFYAMYLHRVLKERYQTYCMAAAIGIVIFSWLWASDIL
jgi:rhomboid protease GluP